MTKAMEWIAPAVAVLATWYAIVSGALAADWARRNPQLATWWPVLAVTAFGVCCVCVIAYRVATFNDCPKAAEELQREIREAKEDLGKKGIEL